MKYDEYLECAKKHLNGCFSLLSSYKEGGKCDKYVWLELYYLSGYILEAIVVFYVYRRYGWRNDKDIDKWYDIEFTKKTGLDFYNNRKKETAPDWVNEFYEKRPKGSLSVEGHHFQHIVNDLLLKEPLEGVPYLGNGEISEEVRKLIECWGSKVRYEYKDKLSLNGDLIADLIKVCDTIYQKIRTK